MMAKRSENFCRACGDTWYPRGQDLSDKCPTCKSPNVTFLSLARMPVGQVRPFVPTRSSGLAIFLAMGGVALVGIVVLAVLFIAVAGSPSKKPQPAVSVTAVDPCAGLCRCSNGSCSRKCCPR
jgi:hypothetical protein